MLRGCDFEAKSWLQGQRFLQAFVNGRWLEHQEQLDDLRAVLGAKQRNTDGTVEFLGREWNLVAKVFYPRTHCVIALAERDRGEVLHEVLQDLFCFRRADDFLRLLVRDDDVWLNNVASQPEEIREDLRIALGEIDGGQCLVFRQSAECCNILVGEVTLEVRQYGCCILPAEVHVVHPRQFLLVKASAALAYTAEREVFDHLAHGEELTVVIG